MNPKYFYSNTTSIRTWLIVVGAVCVSKKPKTSIFTIIMALSSCFSPSIDGQNQVRNDIELNFDAERPEIGQRRSVLNIVAVLEHFVDVRKRSLQILIIHRENQAPS